jgi:hypothetical protein
MRWHALKPSPQVRGNQQIQRHAWKPRSADCKSVGLRLQWFESITCHAGQRLFPAIATGLNAPTVRSSVKGVCNGVEVIRE